MGFEVGPLRGRDAIAIGVAVKLVRSVDVEELGGNRALMDTNSFPAATTATMYACGNGPRNKVKEVQP